MNNKNLIKRFITIIENDVDKTSIECNGKDFTFKVNDTSSKENILSFFNDLFVNVENLPANKISLNLEKVKIENIFFFYDFKSFQSGYSSYKNVFNDSDIVILKSNDKLEIKYKNEENIILQNFYIYREIIDYLNHNPLFSSIATANNEFLLITKEYGFIHLGYNLHEDRTKDFETLKGTDAIKTLSEEVNSSLFDTFKQIGLLRTTMDTNKSELLLAIESLEKKSKTMKSLSRESLTTNETKY